MRVIKMSNRSSVKLIGKSDRKIGTHLFGSCGQTRSANIPIGNVEYFAKISDESSAKR